MNDKILPRSLMNDKQEGKWLFIASLIRAIPSFRELHSWRNTEQHWILRDWTCKGNIQGPCVQVQIGDAKANLQRKKINLNWRTSASMKPGLKKNHQILFIRAVVMTAGVGHCFLDRQIDTLVLEICRFKGRKIIIWNTTTVCILVNILQDMSLQMEEYIESILRKWDELASAVLELVFWNQPYILSSFYLCKSKSIYHICSALRTYLAFIYLPGWDDLRVYVPWRGITTGLLANPPSHNSFPPPWSGRPRPPATGATTGLCQSL